jgi:hypothetical protein
MTVTVLALFPVTPALSLEERENHRARVRRFHASALLQRRLVRLPLPKGEGWGEGEGSNWPATTCENESHTLWTRPEILVALGLETCDTADSEVCATGVGVSYARQAAR